MSELSKINSVVAVGLEPELVEVEVDSGAGIPSLVVVGLPDKAVEESKERVRLAIKNSGFSFPQKKIVVNLAPADVKKEGPLYDLPIAMGVLSSGGFIDFEKIKNIIFLGELSLSGEVKPVKSVVQAAILAKRKDMPLVVPKDNFLEASLIPGIRVLSISHIKELLEKILSDDQPFEKTQKIKLDEADYDEEFDFANIVGQHQAKRVLEISSAGGHNILFSGSPGAGKTLLARSMISILPPLTEEEALELTKIYSVAGMLSKLNPIVKTRPFRSPHHTTSPVAIIGGGSNPRPGEVSLSHRGVLFLDELPEFPRSVLEALRQPLEDGFVTISRAQGTLKLPADFILVAAQNPCPCGYLGDPKHECTCPMNKVLSYKRKISGPLLDRIDLHLNVGPIDKGSLKQKTTAESSREVSKRIIKTRIIQLERAKKLSKSGKLNSVLSKKDLEEVAPLDSSCELFLESAGEKLALSMRSLIKVWRVALTISDLSGEQKIKKEHLAEALGYRHKQDAIYGS
ncbi:MAG: Competence protein ComM [candidate division WS2 bacterium ADurb.Bin280]|uniref:Competence protein ComM n=1 Tax=candidate division WS2 bacterium ADurb.Bin280 TaxID=1852829 RepID=A0A1V5SEM3_9BACT|nr:MAG: Competence protein ComM [candidate division WS2 bacterium ADurb.Bin280]